MLGSSTAAEFTHLADGARAAAIAAAWSPHTAVVAKEVVVVPDGSRGVRRAEVGGGGLRGDKCQEFT